MKKEVRGYTVLAEQEGLNFLKAGDVSLRFHTGEVSDEDKLAISKMYNKSVRLTVVEEGVNAPDIKKIETGEGKSQSKRMHDRIFIIWKKKKEAGETIPDFPEFYRKYTNWLMDVVMAKELNKYDTY